MSRLFTVALVLAMGMVFQTGCGDKSSTTVEKKVETPDGSTTTKTEKSVEKSGDNPPPANP